MRVFVAGATGVLGRRVVEECVARGYGVGGLTRDDRGDALVRLLARPVPTTNERFREVFDWTPTYPTVHEGIDRVVETWEESGLLERSGEGYEWIGA